MLALHDLLELGGQVAIRGVVLDIVLVHWSDRRCRAHDVRVATTLHMAAQLFNDLLLTLTIHHEASIRVLVQSCETSTVSNVTPTSAES